MRIGPTATGQRIQAPFEWDKAKPCPPCQGHVSGGLTSPMTGPNHPSQAPRLGLRKRSLGSISA
jgi:hypothetical protein